LLLRPWCCLMPFIFRCNPSHCHADVAGTAGEVLQQLMEVNCVQRPEVAIQLLSKLTPGLYGCTAMPRPTDTVRPHTSILEATMTILENTPECMRHLCIPIFQNALQRVPDKAPLRNNLATACAMTWSSLGSSTACHILHFLGLLTYGGEPGMRRLGLQCMEEMAISSLENPVDQLVCVLALQHTHDNKNVTSFGCSCVFPFLCVLLREVASSYAGAPVYCLINTLSHGSCIHVSHTSVSGTDRTIKSTPKAMMLQLDYDKITLCGSGEWSGHHSGVASVEFGCALDWPICSWHSRNMMKRLPSRQDTYLQPTCRSPLH
jgi:hypothetical protein